MVFSKPVFQLWPEVPDKTLDWPSSAVSQSADSVALNLFAQFPNHINLLWLCVALSEPPHHCIHPQLLQQQPLLQPPLLQPPQHQQLQPQLKLLQHS